MARASALLAALWRNSLREFGAGRGFSADVAVQVKALRKRTGAPFRDVKIALQECGWDAEAAVSALRKKGVGGGVSEKAVAGGVVSEKAVVGGVVSEKAIRVGNEGLLAVASGDGVTALVEINSETDFVARNGMFRHLATRVARAALGVQAQKFAPGSAYTIDLSALEAVKIKLEHEKLSGEATVQEAVTEVAAIMGENVQLRRGFLVSSTTGIVSSYLHGSSQPGLARVVGLVSLEPEYGILAGQDSEAQIGAAVAMHVVAAKPLFLSRELVPKAILHRETDAFRTKALMSGKTPKVVEKMVQGRLRKYFEETVLLDQKFVINDAMNVQTVLDDHYKQTGRRVRISNFLRMEVGEGLRQR
ncbi:hypothetical protein KC19_6G137000 [Ceratodon purpureus]|nr:hypothetical protein KC19_6G137000 [Ceratodon purpureus]